MGAVGIGADSVEIGYCVNLEGRVRKELFLKRH